MRVGQPRNDIRTERRRGYDVVVRREAQTRSLTLKACRAVDFVVPGNMNVAIVEGDVGLSFGRRGGICSGGKLWWRINGWDERIR